MSSRAHQRYGELLVDDEPRVLRDVSQDVARAPDRYVDEFAGRHNIRAEDTIDQMSLMANAMLGCRRAYRELIAPNGRPAEAREMRL